MEEIQRKYSVSEIDALRVLVRAKREGFRTGYDLERLRTEGQNVCSGITISVSGNSVSVEEELRTLMLAGVTVEELKTTVAVLQEEGRQAYRKEAKRKTPEQNYQ